MTAPAENLEGLTTTPEPAPRQPICTEPCSCPFGCHADQENDED